MVLEIVRDKDQADFRGIRSDFTSRMGGGSIEVRWRDSLVGRRGEAGGGRARLRGLLNLEQVTELASCL